MQNFTTSFLIDSYCIWKKATCKLLDLGAFVGCMYLRASEVITISNPSIISLNFLIGRLKNDNKIDCCQSFKLIMIFGSSTLFILNPMNTIFSSSWEKLMHGKTQYFYPHLEPIHSYPCIQQISFLNMTLSILAYKPSSSLNSSFIFTLPLIVASSWEIISI